MTQDPQLEITTDTGPFVLIPEWVFGLRLSSQAFRLYALLATYADWKDGSAWPSRKTLAQRLDTTTDSIDRWLRELTKTGCVTIERRTDPDNTARNLTNLYRLYRVAPSRKNTATPTRKDTATPGRKNTALTIPNKNETHLEQRDVIKEVFSVWLESTGRDPKRTKLDRPRGTRIRWALANYPQQDVLDAVRGWEHSLFHTGKNDQRKVYNDLTLLLRNADKVEYFRDLYRQYAPIISKPEEPRVEWKPCGKCSNGWVTVTDEKGEERLAPCPCRKPK